MSYSYPIATDTHESYSGPKVLIVGAGLGGLTMALLLEQAGIDYAVFEKNKHHRALGSATSLTPNVLPLLEQLGLLEKVKAISKKVKGAEIFNEGLDRVGSADITEYESICGYTSLIMARPDLHRLLLAHVPPHRVHLNKRVLSILQNENGVMVRTSDNQTHDAEILIGSDGAYSAVRQGLYALMSKDELLPSCDAEDLKVCHMSILGTTEPLDGEKYPSVREELSRCDIVIGHKKPHTWRYFTVPDNRVCWRVDVQMQSTSFTLNDTFRNSEWGSSESSDAIEDDWRAFRLPLGGTVGDLIDATPKESISKVMLEEKLHQTWYHCRTVLMGDSCHKMLPNAGRGAVNAMLDAVVLANCLYEMVDTTPKSILKAFKEYYQVRYPHSKQDLESSQQAARLMAGQKWLDVLARKVVFNMLPNFIQLKLYAKTLSYRPQATFLPMIEKRGTGPMIVQKPSERYVREQEMKKQEVWKKQQKRYHQQQAQLQQQYSFQQQQEYRPHAV